jgi:RNA polymerase sigma-70 factor (ECF subfamily)
VEEPRIDSLNTGDLLAWVSELQAGNPDAAEPTFRRIISRVEKFARAKFQKFPRVGRFVEIDDVVQNSLIRLLAAFRKIRPTSTRHFYALANELIRWELLDLTKRYYGPRGEGSNLAPVPVGDGSGEHAPADLTAPLAAELERWAAFHEAVAALPAEQREVIGLTHYHDWTQAEIANLFGVSVKTVQRWLDAATQTLRQKLGEA